MKKYHFVIAAALVSGCVPLFSMPYDQTKANGGNVEYKEVASGSFLVQNQVTVPSTVIRSLGDLEKFRDEYFLHQPDAVDFMSEIDFSKSLGILVVCGNIGASGYRVKLVSLKANGEALQVDSTLLAIYSGTGYSRNFQPNQPYKYVSVSQAFQKIEVFPTLVP